LASKKQRLAFVVPNFITCFGLSLGIIAILLAIRGDFWNAAWLLTACVIVDKLDGTAARLLNAGSKIGVELDSLSDFVTFCISPGILVAAAVTADGQTLATPNGRILAYASAIIYGVAGAIRLAKFNTIEHSGEGLKRNFEGIPTTMCGAILSSLMLVLIKYDLLGAATPWLPGLLVVMGISMVSHVYLPKLVRRESRILNYFTIFNVAFMPVLIVSRQFPEYLLAMTMLYMVVGIAAVNRRGYEIT
jgi:CDP-diacylglycerol---serine O-phosphatidyltransferase